MSGTHPTPADTTPAGTAPDGRPALRLLSAPDGSAEADAAELARAKARLLHPAARRAAETGPGPLRSVPRPVAI